MDPAARVLSGDRLALARLLTQIENEQAEGLDALSAIYARTGRAHLVGITGASGTGKSTLVNQLALCLRRSPLPGADHPPTVAIVAVDPSSPFTGGAILGDRIRMRDLAGDPGVFIRSMASRGALGGLARTTGAVVEALDAAGFEVILVETVGAGQTEVDIARMAHTTVVVEAPGLGDDIQAIKAGILEIADILVVNKADLPGADHTLRLLRATLEAGLPTRRLLRPDEGGGSAPGAGWATPVLSTVATHGDGVPGLAEAIREHYHHLQTSGELRQRRLERVRTEMEDLLRQQLAACWRSSQPDGFFEAALERVLNREISPRQAIAELVEGKPTEG
jgi:LAO/AO transport system kinase